MAAHGICFDFYYRPKPSQIGQNGLTAAADTRPADSIRLFLTKKARRNKLLILIDSIDIAVRGIELVVNISMGLTPDTGSPPASREAAGGCSSNNSEENPGKYMNGSQSK